MVASLSNGCRKGRPLHYKGLAPVFVVAAGVAGWFQLAPQSPLLFAGSAAGAAEVVDQAVRQKAFFGSSRFLKVLVSNTDMHHLGNSVGLQKIEEQTGTKIRCSKKGHYYPWARKPLTAGNKVLIIAGEEQAVANAFKTVRTTLTEAAPRKIFGFLVPNTAEGALIGSEGEKITEKQKTLDALISLRSTPFLETRVITSSDNPEAADQVAKWLLEEQKDYIEEMRKMLSTVYTASDVNAVETTIYLTLSDLHVRQLIGKGGAMIDKFAKAYRVKFNIDQKNRGPNDTLMVQITGLMGDVHAAHKEILERFVSPKGPFPSSSSRKQVAAVEEDDLDV